MVCLIWSMDKNAIYVVVLKVRELALKYMTVSGVSSVFGVY